MFKGADAQFFQTTGTTYLTTGTTYYGNGDKLFVFVVFLVFIFGGYCAREARSLVFRV